MVIGIPAGRPQDFFQEELRLWELSVKENLAGGFGSGRSQKKVPRPSPCWDFYYFFEVDHLI